MASFRRIEAVFRDSCLKWGYDEVKTPTLEYLHLFTATGTLTPGMLGRVYSFLDWDGWSGQRVVLRPDATIPAVRYYIDSLSDKNTARLCYVANSFTFEETGTENRERWQCGAELIGPSSAMANVELIGLALDVLSNLGIKGMSVKLSHAGLIKALLAQLDLSINEQTRLFDRLLDGDNTILKEIKPQKAGLIKMMTLLLGMKGKAASFLRNIEALVGSSLPQIKPALDDFAAVIDLLEEYLMTLVKPQVVARTGRILVCATPPAVSQAFAMADKLRHIGWVVKFGFDDSTIDDCGWRLDVGDKNNQVELTDLINDKEFSVNSVNEVLKILGRSDVA
jgi:histidyl-tRNA synthetase